MKVAYGIGWMSASILESFLQTRWDIIDYSRNKMKLSDVVAENPDVVISFSPPEEILSSKKLRYIIISGAGIDHLNLEKIKERKQILINTHGNSNAVAEHAWALLLSAARKLNKYDSEIRQLRAWPDTKHVLDYNVDLHGKTMGIVGYGAIGRKIEQIARAFSMEIMIFRNNPDEGQFFDDELIEQVENLDVLVLAAPLTDKTKGMINEAIFKKIPSHAILVNIARGELIDEKALINALIEGDLRAAAIDVWQHSPYYGGDGITPEEFVDIPNLVISPHRAWVSLGSFTSTLKEIAQELDKIARKQNSTNIIDLDRTY